MHHICEKRRKIIHSYEYYCENCLPLKKLRTNPVRPPLSSKRFKVNSTRLPKNFIRGPTTISTLLAMKARICNHDGRMWAKSCLMEWEHSTKPMSTKLFRRKARENKSTRLIFSGRKVKKWFSPSAGFFWEAAMLVGLSSITSVSNVWRSNIAR